MHRHPFHNPRAFTTATELAFKMWKLDCILLYNHYNRGREMRGISIQETRPRTWLTTWIFPPGYLPGLACWCRHESPSDEVACNLKTHHGNWVGIIMKGSRSSKEVPTVVLFDFGTAVISLEDEVLNDMSLAKDSIQAACSNFDPEGEQEFRSDYWFKCLIILR